MKNYLSKQTKDVLENPKTTIEELKTIEPIMRENCITCVKQFYKYYFSTIVLIMLWFLINNSVIERITFLDITITNKSILLLSIPFLSCVSFYHANCYFSLYQMIGNTLGKIYDKIFPNFKGTALTPFTEYPSIVSLDNLRRELQPRNITAIIFSSVMLIILNILPIVMNIWILIKLSILTSGSWYVVLPLFYIVVTLKTVNDLIFFYNQAQD